MKLFTNSEEPIKMKVSPYLDIVVLVTAAELLLALCEQEDGVFSRKGGRNYLIIPHSLISVTG